MQPLLQAIEQYLERCEYEKNLSADTLKAYRIDLRQFSEFTKYKWASQDPVQSVYQTSQPKFCAALRQTNSGKSPCLLP